MNCEETVWEMCTANGIGGYNMLILVMLARERDSRPDGGWLSKREIACRQIWASVPGHIRSAVIYSRDCMRAKPVPGCSIPAIGRG